MIKLPFISRLPKWIIKVALAGLCLAAVNLIILPYVQNAYISSSSEQSKSTLRLVLEGVDQAIHRFEPVPNLVAGDPILKVLLHDSQNEGLIHFINEKLRQTAVSVGASAIYVKDPKGMTIVSSNYREEASFVGKNFAFRPYFKRAITGEAARFHALGTTSDERGFFFSTPILDGIEVLGVLTVKVTVDQLENSWEGAPVDIIVADTNGIAFLSSSQEYRMNSLLPLSDEVKKEIVNTRQFPLDAVTPLLFSANIIGPSAVKVTLGIDGMAEKYLAESAPLSWAGWHAIVLAPLSPIWAEVMQTLLFWNLIVIVLGLGLILLLQARSRALERMRDEVRVRTHTEKRLKKTQKDLVQAGKLAALGKMSAAISHEINQPLAAVKSYAENARKYIQRERVGEADENIKRISDMVDRMAKISNHLRNFARQPGETIRPILVNEVILDSIEIMRPTLKQTQTELDFKNASEEFWALGGRLRLQQVLVNILNNAIDALLDCSDKNIKIEVYQTSQCVNIEICDNGPGLSKDNLDQVFEAFFTTKEGGKEAGSGMGLGLSIAYNIIEDFGGKLSAQNPQKGGAMFKIELQRVVNKNQTLAAE